MILLTGTRGFIGSNFKRLLEREGDNCISFFSDTLEVDAKKPFWEKLTSTIIFCGGYVAHSKNELQNSDSAVKSWCAIQKIIEHRFPNLKKIIFLSTTDVYRSGIDLNEKSEVEFSNLYTSTKLNQEDYLRNYCKNEGIPFLLIRIGSVYGPGDYDFQKFIPVLVRHAIEGKTFYCYVNPSYVVQPVYIDDVSKVLYSLVQDVKDDLVLNLVGPELLTLESVVEECTKHVNVRVVYCESENLPYRKFERSKYLDILNASWTGISHGIESEIEGARGALNRK